MRINTEKKKSRKEHTKILLNLWWSLVFLLMNILILLKFIEFYDSINPISQISLYLSMLYCTSSKPTTFQESLQLAAPHNKLKLCSCPNVPIVVTAGKNVVSVLCHIEAKMTHMQLFESVSWHFGSIGSGTFASYFLDVNIECILLFYLWPFILFSLFYIYILFLFISNRRFRWLMIKLYIQVTTPLLKFMAEFVLNKAQRLTFDSSSPNGILLFREVSKLIVAYGSRILSLPNPADIYAFKYKGIWISLTILTRGKYIAILLL